jgi:hypothetical protein
MEFNSLKFNPSRRFEDELLMKYYGEVGGQLFLEVRVGQGGVKTYPSGAKPRRIDAVRISTGSNALIPSSRKTISSFSDLIFHCDIQVIEIKKMLNRPAIGQVIVGAKLIEMEYPEVGQIEQVILCEISDPVLDLVCREINIKVWKPKMA